MSRRSRRARAAPVVAAVALGLLGREARRRRAEDVRGQVVVITGGSRGLGFLLAREFGRAGCRIVICARDAAELERARADLERQGIEALALPCDVADRAQVERLIGAATERFGTIDVLVNNAGVIQVGPAPTMTVRDDEEALGTMFWGTLYPTLAVLPAMRARRRGRIVTITSIGGKVSVPHLLPYNAAKFAAVGFSEGLRAELARDGVRVTTIVPGLMRTGSYLNARFKGRQDAEYALFAPLASLRLVSMDAERAARQIVAATRGGEAERILSLPAALLARLHGLFPGATADLLGLVNRLLPSADGGTATPARGMEIEARLHSDLHDALTAPGRSAARRFHQYPGPVALLCRAFDLSC